MQLAPQALAPAGGSLPHNNMQPYLTVELLHRAAGDLPGAAVGGYGSRGVQIRCGVGEAGAAFVLGTQQS